MPSPTNISHPLTQGRRIALVIGMNAAPNSYLPRLEHAAADAQAIAEVLQRYCNFELLVPPLLNEYATSENVQKTVCELAQDRTDEDFLLFYFCGHGQPMKVKGNHHDVYLVTHDFQERDVEVKEDCHFSMRWLRNHLYIPTEAGQVLIILDCCYAGDIGRISSASDQMEEMHQQITHIFNASVSESGVRTGGLRAALTATGHDKTAREGNGHGVMTGLLFPALRGGVVDVLGKNGEVALELLFHYLSIHMPSDQHPSLSGDFAGRSCIIANHPERINRPRNILPPHQYIQYQSRTGEFEHLEQLLFGQGIEQKSLHTRLVGIVGMGGVGKTQLAIEIAYRYKDRFPAGIFWIAASGEDLTELQYQFSELAVKTGYLPAKDDPSNSENEANRARHFCQYLAVHDDALLIMDNVEDPNLTLSMLSTLANGDICSTLLYTSRNTLIPAEVQPHSVVKLSIDNALRLLLQTTRPALLAITLAGSQDPEPEAARDICHYVECLPLGLVMLRELLIRDIRLPLVRLCQVLKQRGALEIARSHDANASSLFATFHMSWEKVVTADARCLLKLASYFPEATPIPLWLLGLATGLGESGDILEPLGAARIELQEWSLLEEWSEGQVRLHPLIREFGHRLIAESKQAGKALLEEARERLITEFTNLNRLEERTRRDGGYWQCLESVRLATKYAKSLGTNSVEQLETVERWLAREGSFFESEDFWPEKIPGLYYQQLYNRAVEEKSLLLKGAPPTRWLRQVGHVGAEDSTLLRILRQSDEGGAIRNVAFSPDGRKLVTGSNKTLLWDVANGQLQLKLTRKAEERQRRVVGVVFSHDSTRVTVAYDNGTICVWNVDNGQLLMEYKGQVWDVACAAFSLDGKLVILGSGDEAVAKVWDMTNERVIATLDSRAYINEKYSYIVADVAFSPDSTKAVVVTIVQDEGFMGGVTLLWDVMHEKVLTVLKTDTDKEPFTATRCAAFSPDGMKIALGSWDHRVRVWDVAYEKVIVTLTPSPHSEASFTKIAFSSDGTLVVTGSADNVARVWDMANKAMISMLQSHTTPVTSVTFSSDGKRIATGSKDGTTRIWNLEDKTALRDTKKSYDSVGNVVFSPDGKNVLATSVFDDSIWVWDVAQGEVVTIWKGGGSHKRGMAFSRSGKYLLEGSFGAKGVSVWNVPSGKYMGVLEKSPGHSSSIMSIAFSSDGDKFVTGSLDGTAIIWDMKRDTQTILKRDDHSDHLVMLSVNFSPDNSKVITGASDGEVHIWDVASGKILASLHNLGKVNHVVFSPDGNNVLTIWGENGIQVSNATNGEFVTYLFHTGTVTTICFSPDGELLFTSDNRGEVRLWQTGKHKELYFGQLLSIYVTPYEIGDIYWQDRYHVVLADKGDRQGRLHFYKLALEGM